MMIKINCNDDQNMTIMYVHKKWSDLMIMKKQTFVLEILNGVNIMYKSKHHL